MNSNAAFWQILFMIGEENYFKKGAILFFLTVDTCSINRGSVSAKMLVLCFF
jgi:hypothetical protein